MLKLSLLDASFPVSEAVHDSPASKAKKRLGKKKAEPKTSMPSPQERLEAFMDKLSMWQLLSELESQEKDASKESKDWMQTFCEDVLEPEFVHCVCPSNCHR